MKHIILTLWLVCSAGTLAAQKPLYIVNGTPRDEIASIPPDEIESLEALPADEETIARYGDGAQGGVLLVTLRYDTPARFEADTSFARYIARRVKWADDEPAARVVVRYRITPAGDVEVDKVLESTDSRLKRRVLKALSKSPRWQPARKQGVAVASSGVLRLQLPEGKPMPRPVELCY